MKKPFVKRDILIDYTTLCKYIDKRLVDMVDRSFFGTVCNIVSFHIDSNAVMSRDIIKVQKKLEGSNSRTMYFAYNFTLEAVDLINDSGGAAFYMQDFPWTDQRLSAVRNSIRG
ncbi:MAG: hypothetical protein J6L99_01845 [Ruminococcus sp.]|nr:hypothetical protein [Ruminococcus sp.]